MLRNLVRWIEEVVKNLSRRNLEISMDQESIEIYQEKTKKARYKEKLSSLKKRCFQEEKNSKRWMQKASYLNKDPINIINSQNISQHKSIATINPKANTHTQQVQTILYFKNKLRQFSKYILTHVILVMAKSHCTYTCIKSSKEYAGCVWKYSKSA